MPTELEPDLDCRLARLGTEIDAASPAVELTDITTPQRSSVVRRRVFTAATGLAAACVLAVIGFGVFESESGTSEVLALPANTAWYAVVAPADANSVADCSTCMSNAGYDSDEIGSPPVGRIPSTSIWSDVTFQRAFRRCIVDAGLGDFEGDNPEEVAAKNAKATGITSCIRDLGWTMPDPTVHPVAGYLVPGSPDVPTDPNDAHQQLDDLTNCGSANDIAVFP